MRMSKLLGRQVKEVPKDAQTTSHIYLLRGGYIRPVSTGIYSLLPLGKKIAMKIEGIIREEMNRVEGQEVLLPVVLPRELWEESGRYESVGSELLRFQDRNQKDMLLGMTHEEAVVHLARSEINSYRQLPAMMYQIQTKYRDEARPRAGLIRVREFTMKDAYSFHASQECLAQYYQRMHESYTRIFKRLGMKQVLSIESDSGMMGGDQAHEFMAIAECGEDTIFISPNGEYQANKEVATSTLAYVKEAEQALEKVHTPNQKTIEDVATFLNKDASQTAKAVFYTDAEGQLVFACVRGDLEVNEVKLKKQLQSNVLDVAPEALITAAGAVAGYASGLGMDPQKVRMVIDHSVVESSNLVVGANEHDYHYLNFNFERDMGQIKDQVIMADIVSVREGDPCPVTGEPLQMTRGIEVGNIFQLGTKYTHPMSGTYLNETGRAKDMIMGCYGIGVGRAIASVIEQSHDKWGPIWPISIAPYTVHLLALNLNKEGVKETSEHLYNALLKEGIEVLYDDRNKKAGFSFSDADLIAAPFRIVISPKTLAKQQAEFRTRDGSMKDFLELDDVVSTVKEAIEREKQKFDA